MEKWKEIPGFDGFYEVSNRGRIRSWHNNTNTPGRRDEPIILSPEVTNVGYERVTLRDDNSKRVHITIHRQVCESFVDNPDDKPCVNHKDGCYTNNNASNLEWVTHKENTAHAYENGLMNPPKGEGHWKTSLTREDVIDIRNAYRLGCFTQKEIAEAYGITRPNVSMIVNRKSWVHV